MPATEHPVFEPPPDPRIAVWRYMDFTKFVSMLEHEGLYFCRADLLGDPFEGSRPIANEGPPDAVAARLEESYEARGVHPASRSRSGDIGRQLNRGYVKFTYVNCWHMNEHESAAMWKLYGQYDKAIAIRSTFERFQDCLDNSVYVGAVRYIDYRSDPIPGDNIYWPLVHKRASFSHEREIRACIVTHPPNVDGVADFTVPQPDGRWLDVDLATLIDEVYVSPGAPAWLHELVSRVVRRYGLDLTVVESSLAEEPHW